MMLPDSWNNSLHCFFLQHCWSEEFKLDKTKLSWWWGEMADIGRSVFQKWPNCSFLRDPSLGRMYIVDKIIFCWTSSLKPPKLLNVFKSSCSRRHSDEDYLMFYLKVSYWLMSKCILLFVAVCEDILVPQVLVVKTPSGHKTSPSPSNQPLGKWTNF